MLPSLRIGPPPFVYERSIMDIDDETLKHMLVTIQAGAIQGSATAQILTSLLMVLDVPTLQHIRTSLQSSAESQATEPGGRQAFDLAVKILDVVINGPAPRTRLKLVPGKES